jgi:quinoprotein glucose dehydrogenase
MKRQSRNNPRRIIFPALSLIILSNVVSCDVGDDRYQTWKQSRGDAGSSSYSSLDQINRDNVNLLEVAWIYHSGDQDDIDWIYSASQVNPIVIDEVMYLTTPAIKVAALNAATGEASWIFDPFEDDDPSGVNRGVVYWEDGDDRRIFFSAGPYLYALDAGNGLPVNEFGDAGRVDLREDLGRDPALISVSYTSPGIIHKDLLIMGSSVGEGPGAAPGHIRAYNTLTGEIEWIFHTIPHPGEFGYETWGSNAWQLAGGANNWGGMSLDTEKEIVFVPTGSPAPDFYTPGTRGAGKHLFSNTILALDANSGERIWHYQTIRHDLWDYDLPAPPNLVTINRDGREIDALAQISKHGFVFVLDRETGEPLFPVEERSVPESNIEGEEVWPVQRFPIKPEPLIREHVTEDDLTDRTPEAREYALERFRELHYEGIFTPADVQETLSYPGTRGGATWGGASYDPESNMLYVNVNDFGTTYSLRRVEVPEINKENVVLWGESLYQANCASCHGIPGNDRPSQYPDLDMAHQRYTETDVLEIMDSGRGIMPPFPHLSEEEKSAIVEYLFNLDLDGSTISVTEPDTEENYTYSYVVDSAYQLFLDQDGYPATKPPWGSLNAIDLNTGDLVWKVPLGEYQELTEQGIPVTGTQNLGGSIVTSGGLVFIAAAEDEIFRAFDKDTGEILWEYDLPAGGHAIPSTYEIDGRQYIVIAATGGSRVGTTKGDTYIAFSLPE